MAALKKITAESRIFQVILNFQKVSLYWNLFKSCFRSKVDTFVVD